MNSSSARQAQLESVGFRKALLVLGVSLGLMLFCLPAFSQLNLGRIFGAITDQTGGALAGATVTVIDVARGVSRPLVSDGAGQFDANSLTPGTYTVRAEAKGFKVGEHTDIEVGVGKEVRVDLTLQPGEQSQTVTVTGDLPMVNTANAELGGTLEQLAVSELPVEGRDYAYLLATRPGMTLAPGAGQFSFSSNGTGTAAEMWMIDGVMDTNEFVGGPALVGGSTQNGDEANILPLDAIQEVNIIENPNAEYGDRPGAHVNVGLKSGTNTLHGTAYAYGKDGSMAAKNPFLTAALPKAPLTLEQFGASAGGPIKKDKVFFFANYEGQRFTVGVPRIAVEPTTATLSSGGTPLGDVSNSLPDAIAGLLQTTGANKTVPSALSLNLAGCGSLIPAGGTTPSGYLSAATVALLKTMSNAQLANGCKAGAGLWSNSQGLGTPGGAQNLVTDLINSGGSDNGIIKVDVHLNSKNALNFDWFSGGGNSINAASVIQPYWESETHDWANMGRAVWIWTPNSTWLNEFRFGYDYGSLPIYVRECDHPGIGPNYASFGFVSGTAPCQSGASPGKDVLGGFPLTILSGGITELGATNGFTQDNFQHYETVLDNVSWTHGKHVVTFGVEFRLLQFYGDALSQGLGILTFTNATAFKSATTLEDFLGGATGSSVILVGNVLRKVTRNSYAGYVQDAWRVLPRVTVNAGLRYEFLAPLKSPADNIAIFNPSIPLAANFTGLDQETKSHNIYNNYPYNFSPRLGVSWDIFGKGRTVLHVGAGVLYDVAPNLIGGLLFPQGGLSALPTGFTFYDAALPAGLKGPGSILAGNINSSGGVPNDPNNAGNANLNPASNASNTLPWALNTPVFNVSPSGLVCGDGTTLPTAGPAFNNAVGAVQKAPAPCTMQTYGPHDRLPYFITQTLGIQHAFTNNLSVSIAYVGTRGENLNGSVNINAPTTGVSNKDTPGNNFTEQIRRPYYVNGEYPFYSDINQNVNYALSNYNSLQTQLSQRLSHGLNFTVGYTWSHSLGFNSIENPLNPRMDYGSNGNPQQFNFTATYYVPGVKTPGQILQGWQLNTSVYMLAAAATTLSDSINDLSGNSVSDRWSMSTGGTPTAFQLGGPGLQIPCYGVAGSSFAKATNCTTVAALGNMPALCQATAAAEPTAPTSGLTGVPLATPNETGPQSLASFGCYVVGGTALVPPAQGTFGNMGTGTFYGKPFRVWDFSVTKNWKFKERYGVQFRAELYNLLNRTLISGAGGTNLGSPSTLGQTTSTPDAGNAVIGNGPRKIQLGLKISF